MTQSERTGYGFGKQVRLPYGEAIARTKTALASEGFGTITEIDMQQTLKEKRGTNFRPYVILGVCNPALAEQALAAELEIGLLLPCNVIVYETSEGSMIEALDPVKALHLADNPALGALAQEARKRLQRALARVV
jgi:uncharacterized protein (DUF302 family)